MAKLSHTTKKGGELVTKSTLAELKKAILDEVSSLKIVTWEFFSKFSTVHKGVVHLNGCEERCARRSCTL